MYFETTSAGFQENSGLYRMALFKPQQNIYVLKSCKSWELISLTPKSLGLNSWFCPGVPVHSIMYMLKAEKQENQRTTILFPGPADFLRHMLDENEGSGKDQFLSDPDWLSEMQYNTMSLLLADY